MRIINPNPDMKLELISEWQPVDKHDAIPPYRYRFENGTQWCEILDDDNWMHLGYCPMPKTRWQWFVYHIAHGLLMRYPLWKILPYALKYCNPESEIDDVHTS